MRSIFVGKATEDKELEKNTESCCLCAYLKRPDCKPVDCCLGAYGITK